MFMSSTYIDVKYINLCSTVLERFKQKTTNLWNFRCPMCGDSKKHKNKCRGFIYEKKNNNVLHITELPLTVTPKKIELSLIEEEDIVSNVHNHTTDTIDTQMECMLSQ